MTKFIHIETPVAYELLLTWDDIANVPVADATSVANWNTFFNLPALGTAFTSVICWGNIVNLKGGSGITTKASMFLNNVNLLKVEDTLGCITNIGVASFRSCGVTSFSFPEVIAIDSAAFRQCSATVFSAPKTTTLGNQCFYAIKVESYYFPLVTAVGDGVWNSCWVTEIYIPTCANLGTTTGNNYEFYYLNYTHTYHDVTLTIPAALMTCNGGAPDGDITYFQGLGTLNPIVVQV